MAFFSILCLTERTCRFRIPMRWSWRMWKRIPAVRQRQGRHRGMWCGMVLCGFRCRFLLRRSGLKKLAGYAKLDKISVQYFDAETSELKLSEMYVTGYKAKLKKDTSYKGLWTVSFTLKEM